MAPGLWNEARRVVVVVDHYGNIPTLYADDGGKAPGHGFCPR
ncbi:hypothetical protein D187_008045 [Cystobacter fuscus DSM 2262]|uniref:Uncharacterized protein n=1 Tax=Cystobacter fuscus (strain ATCC 25194 / DSM 2262 / NBRC 100088 / M29) TaxID=1242864 RepID=S9QJQ8_CYSF2|nr:hypothetical protein [Cystobacter fuscus]EPX56703.1 hypothetical protein D187_008045 [Cystobacter fuscus DSM 2262]